MMHDYAPSEKRNAWNAIFIFTVFAFLGTTAIGLWVSFDLLVAPGTLKSVFLRYWTIGEYYYAGMVQTLTLGQRWELFWHFLGETGIRNDFLLRMIPPLALATLAAVGAFFWSYTPGGKEIARHITGKRQYSGRAAMRQIRSEAKKEIKREGDSNGIRFHPSVPVPKARESEHTVVIGKSGAGKTRVILQMAVQAVLRGDLNLFYDNKPEFIGYFYDSKTSYILSPFDKRGVAWAIALDVFNKPLAVSAASRWIQETDQPEWSNGARAIVAGFLVHCQTTFGKEWGWEHIRDLKNLPDEGLFELMQKSYPSATSYVNPESKSSGSYISTMRSNLEWIDYVAEAWPRSWEKGRGISIRKWVRGKYRRKNLFIPDHPELDSIAGPLLNSVVSIAGRVILKQSNTGGRIVNFFLDEIANAPKNPDLLRFASLFRSKGARLIYGLQDRAQLRMVYDKDMVQAQDSIIGNWVILGVSPIGGTAQELSDSMGTRVVERPQFGSDGKVTWQKDEVPVVRPDELSGLPKASKKHGVHGYYVNASWDGVFRLTWPSGKHLSPQTEDLIEADWVNAGADDNETAPTSREDGKRRRKRAKTNAHGEAVTKSQSDTKSEVVAAVRKSQDKTSEREQQPLADDASDKLAEESAKQQMQAVADAAIPGFGAMADLVDALAEANELQADEKSHSVMAHTKQKKKLKKKRHNEKE